MNTDISADAEWVGREPDCADGHVRGAGGTIGPCDRTLGTSDSGKKKRDQCGNGVHFDGAKEGFTEGHAGEKVRFL